MDGATWTGGYHDLPAVPGPWEIVGIGDFNGDENADLLWRNPSTWRTTIWYMDGATWSGGYADISPTVTDPDWKIVGVADFNGDYKPDLLWRNSVTGRTTIWYMDGATWTGGYHDLPAVPGPWEIVGIGDFNGDGNADLLWRNPSTGRATVWYMDGATWTGGGYADLPTVPSPWEIVGCSTSTSVLLYDDFNGSIVNANNWHIPTWVSSTDGTFIGQTQFRCSQNAPLPAAINSNAIIALDTYNPTANQPGSSFYGTDLISNQSFALGQGITVTVRAKMNADTPTGIVGGIFLYAPPASTSDTLHDEIDFELLSKDPYHVWTNIYGNELLGAGHPASYSYASGSATDYHIYQIQWLPDRVSWYVDGTLVRTVTNQSPIPVGPMYVHFNIWVPGEDFAAAYDRDLHPAKSQSDNQTFSMSVDSVTVQ